MDAKTLLAPLRAAQYDFDPDQIARALDTCAADGAPFHLAHPFETLDAAGYVDVLRDLQTAWPDLERRETIVLDGKDRHGQHWIGMCGYWTGTSLAPWMGIPPSGHQIAMRFHEFFEIRDGKIVQMQTLWDLPEVMLQCGAWPMAPALGREWQAPGPATQDGLTISGSGAAAEQVVADMLTGLGRFAEGGLEAMDLPRYWHPKFSWYGPSGIGTGRGLAGFRNWHQIPFLRGMPDREGGLEGHFFAQGNYVGFTAWPGMKATISGDGFIGIAPAGQQITMRSLDFWRVEGNLIRENWVLVDLLHIYHQIGVDVLDRMRELVKPRTGLLEP